MTKPERLAWAERVQHQLLELLPPGAEIIVLAGVRYREGIVSFLRRHGFKVEVPMNKLAFGQQLRWLNEQQAAAAPFEGADAR
jgi:hypothetical protein